MPAAAVVDAVNQRVRMGAAHERDMQHAGKLQIVKEAATPCGQGYILDPLDRFANVNGAIHTM